MQQREGGRASGSAAAGRRSRVRLPMRRSPLSAGTSRTSVASLVIAIVKMSRVSLAGAVVTDRM